MVLIQKFNDADSEVRLTQLIFDFFDSLAPLFHLIDCHVITSLSPSLRASKDLGLAATNAGGSLRAHVPGDVPGPGPGH